MENYRTCRRCIMTEKGDAAIRFDEDGNCSYCTLALKQYPNSYCPNEKGKEKLKEVISYLKKKNKDRRYDCLMGVSGGLDSSYLAYLGAAKWGLRILAIHVDDGFDTEISQENLKRLCDKCGIDMVIIKPDEEQYKELIRAYMLAGVPNLAIPQDNVLVSSIYKFAKENDIHDFLSGQNFSLECILQKGNTHDTFDMMNIIDINEKFGRNKIDKLLLMSLEEVIADRKALQVVEYQPLNFIPYTRVNALKELADFCGFQYYGAKHLENYFTGFLQLYWLPQKFHQDKRTSHLSSMIVTGQMTREEAINCMKIPPYEENWLQKTNAIIKTNFGFTDREFEEIMKQTVHQHNFYETSEVSKQDKYKGYYNLLNKWLCIKNSGGKLETYFVKHNHKKIAVYGMGNIGKRFCEEMKDSKVVVKYVIDVNMGSIFSSVPIVELSADLEPVDVIIVTAIFEFNEIKRQIDEVINCDVVSIDDVVSDLL